jgi:hypothetical protein
VPCGRTWTVSPLIIGTYRSGYSQDNSALVSTLEEPIRLGIRPLKVRQRRALPAIHLTGNSHRVKVTFSMMRKSSQSARPGTRSAIVLAAAIVLGGLSSLSMAQGTPAPGSVTTGQGNSPSVAADQTNPPGVVSYPPPPAGFDPLTASDEALKRYGFPPKPDQQSDPKDYAIWKKMVLVPRKGNPILHPTTIHDGPAHLLAEPPPTPGNPQ